MDVLVEPERGKFVADLSRRRFLQYGVLGLGGAALMPRGLTANRIDPARRAQSSSSFTYNLWSYDDPSGVQTFQKMAAAYNKTASAQVEFKISTLAGSGATIYPAKIQSLISSGSPPDLFLDWIGTLLSPFVDEGAVQPLTGWFDKYGWDDVLVPDAVNYVTQKGHPYEVPIGVFTMPVWYNKTLFKKAGVTPPTTYAEWEAVNNALLRAGAIPAAEAVIDGWDIMRLFEQLLEMTAGPTLHDELLELRTSWDNPAVVDAFELLREWGDKWIEKGALGSNPDDTGLLFTSGKAAQSIQGNWEVSSLTPAQYKDYDMFVPPKQDGGPARLGGFAQGYAVSSHVTGDALDALGAFFNWFIQPAQAHKYLYDGYTATRDGIPAGNELALKAEAITAQNKVYLIMDEALGTELANGYFVQQQGVLAGSVTPAAAAAKMQAAVGQYMKS
jgi:raffinose/stachyose/melibiose transport system substrate-binding protein